MDEAPKTDDKYSRKLDELDHLLNDPDVPTEPSRIWHLLAELTHYDLVSQSSAAFDDDGAPLDENAFLYPG